MRIRELKGNAVPSILSPFLRARMPPLNADQTYTVLFFPMDEKSVVFSGAATRALSRIQRKVLAQNSVLAVGGGFTAEARTVLEAAGVTILAHSNFHWTDASYQNIHQRLYRK